MWDLRLFLGGTKSHLSQVHLHGLSLQPSLVPCLLVLDVSPNVLDLTLQTSHGAFEVGHLNVVGVACDPRVELPTCLLGHILSLKDLLRLKVYACLYQCDVVLDSC